MSGFGHLNFKLNINVSLEDPHHREISLIQVMIVKQIVHQGILP